MVEEWLVRGFRKGGFEGNKVRKVDLDVHILRDV